MLPSCHIFIHTRSRTTVTSALCISIEVLYILQGALANNNALTGCALVNLHKKDPLLCLSDNNKRTVPDRRSISQEYSLCLVMVYLFLKLERTSEAVDFPTEMPGIPTPS